MDTQRSFTTQRDFGTVDAEYARVSARRTKRCADRPSGQEAQFHQSISEIGGKIQVN